jgi:hypothetical protein
VTHGIAQKYKTLSSNSSTTKKENKQNLFLTEASHLQISFRNNEVYRFLFVMSLPLQQSLKEVLSFVLQIMNANKELAQVPSEVS